MPVSLNAELERKKAKEGRKGTHQWSFITVKMNNLLHTNKSQKGQLFGDKRRDFFSIWV